MVFFNSCNRINQTKSQQFKITQNLPDSYTVISGDTYEKIAKKLGFPNGDYVKQLANSKNKYLILGQVLNFKKNKKEFRAGCTLKSIAKKYNMDYESFLRLNRLDNLISKDGKHKDFKILKNQTFYIIKGFPHKKSSTQTPSNNTPDVRIRLGNGKVTTAKKAQAKSIENAKVSVKNKFKTYCKTHLMSYDENLLDLSPIDDYPQPVVKNGKITTTIGDLLRPTGKSNGKIVILNAGHGGYNKHNGYFDPGSYSFIKKADGKYIPLFEYDIAKTYTEEMAEKLRAKGYSVIITSGNIQTFKDNKEEGGENAFAKLINDLQRKGYTKDDISLLSLHTNSTRWIDLGTSVLTNSNRDKVDKDFVDKLNSSLNEDDDIYSELEQDNLDILRQSYGIKSALVEIEYINGFRQDKLVSDDFRNTFIDKLLQAF